MISILQENAVKALTELSRIVENKPVIPVMAYVAITSEDSRLAMTTSNPDMWLTWWIGAKIDTPMNALLPAKFLLKVLKAVSPEIARLRVGENHDVVLNCGNSTATIKGLDPESYIAIPEMLGKTCEIDGAEFRTMINEVAYMASHEDTRPILRGVYLRLENDTITLAASDQYRLAERTAHLDMSVATPVETVLPAESLQTIVKMLEKDAGNIDLAITDETTQFHTRWFDATVKAIPGRFPDYRAAIPRSSNREITVCREDLLTACKRVEVFTKDNGGSALFVGVSNTLAVSANNKECGTFESKIDGMITGDAIHCRLNLSHILDSLKAVKDERITLSTNGSSNAVIMRSEGREDLINVHMPMYSTT